VVQFLEFFFKTGSRNMVETCAVDFVTKVSYSAL